MKIITVDREFGSGGRELGKRLADALQIPCYDQEIIEEVATMYNLDPDHVEHISESDIRMIYPMTIGRRFHVFTNPAMVPMQVLVSQQEVIKSLASKGDCVIVGRCADLILREMNPLNLFVYANQESKLQRCVERMTKNETGRDILRHMQRIDRERAAFRDLLADSKWGQRENYHLCINTSDKSIKELIPALADYVRRWFAV